MFASMSSGPVQGADDMLSSLERKDPITISSPGAIPEEFTNRPLKVSHAPGHEGDHTLVKVVVAEGDDLEVDFEHHPRVGERGNIENYTESMTVRELRNRMKVLMTATH